MSHKAYPTESLSPRREEETTPGVVALIALAGCSGLSGGQPGVDENNDENSPSPKEGIDTDTNSTGAENVTYAVGIEVDDSIAGQDLDAVGATYPRENFTVEAAQHDEILIGVDTDDDEEIDRRFEEGSISGVNNNAYSFDVTMDTDYALQRGDVVVIEYPDVDNPDDPGEYTVETRLNDQQMADATVVIES